MVNANTIHTMCKLLDSYESDVIGSELRNTSDIELLLNFVLVVCIFSLGYFGTSRNPLLSPSYSATAA